MCAYIYIYFFFILYTYYLLREAWNCLGLVALCALLAALLGPGAPRIWLIDVLLDQVVDEFKPACKPAPLNPKLLS